MTECEHALSLSQRIFAYRGRGRECAKCGGAVYVPTPVFDVLLGLSIVPVAILSIAALLHRGVYLTYLILLLVLLVVFYVTELRSRTPVGYDHTEYHRHTKRNLVILLVAASGVVAFFLWLLR